MRTIVTTDGMYCGAGKVLTATEQSLRLTDDSDDAKSNATDNHG